MDEDEEILDDNTEPEAEGDYSDDDEEYPMHFL